ncbi:hypothetical protein P5V15_005583 [Pogonomyrmex californicus]
MMKIACTPLSKLMPIDTSNICPKSKIKPTLSEVLQSDSVKRLFNQPNLIIKTIPLNLLTESNKDMFWHKRNGINATSSHASPADISIHPVRAAEEEKEDANLLPSKIEDKKSEIALLPIEKKLCGHREPCENIVCDVTVQQYVDKDTMSPMISVNIEDDEINAPVAKHCENKYCDALSIDHNRCRRALINLHRCDRSHVCDICGITLKKWMSRVYHKNCARKNEYVHNNVDRLHLLKERMRMRELQILEIARMKKHNYSDPARAMEILWKNEELIIIPQTVSSQRPIVNTISVPSSVPQSTDTNLTNTQLIKINSSITKVTNIFGSKPLSSQSAAICCNTSHLVENKINSLSQVRYPNLQQNSRLVSTPTPTPDKTLSSTSTQVPVAVPVSVPVPIPALAVAQVSTTSTSTPTPVSTSVFITTSAPSSVIPSQKQCLHLAVSPQSATSQPIAINNWIVSPSRILTTTPVQSKTLLAPIRVVPITNLISPPSLLHHTQGIPKFCIVAEKVTESATNPPNSPSVQSADKAVDTAATKLDTSNVLVQSNLIPKVRKNSKLLKTKKNFFCVYCSKNITTGWYFKVHIAKHKGEKLFFCSFCDESFSNNYDMKKHITNQHTDQKELKCDYTCTSPIPFKNDVQTHSILSVNKANIQLEKQKELEFSKDETSHTLIQDSYEKKVKRLKCEDTSNSQNEIKKYNTEKLSTINKGSNAKTKGFTFVSVKEIVNPENFKQDSVITSR